MASKADALKAAVSSKDREKALEAALANIDKNFGKGAIMRLGSTERPPVEVIPTGSIALDVALGIGGLPRGRIVEIYGPESSGKTTLTPVSYTHLDVYKRQLAIELLAVEEERARLVKT